jgi:hypothetical protein
MSLKWSSTNMSKAIPIYQINLSIGMLLNLLLKSWIFKKAHKDYVIMHMDFFTFFLHMIFQGFYNFLQEIWVSFTCDLFLCASYMEFEQNEEVINALNLASWTLKNLETTCMLPPFVILNNKQMDI